MKEIKLTQGFVAIVDDEDYERLNEYKWQAVCKRYSYYAKRYIRRKDNRKEIGMHQEVLNITDTSILVDHIDHNGLNNQKSNLRIATVGQNKMNALKQRNNTSGFKGVVRHKNKWQVSVKANHKRHYFGSFDDKVEAARVYDDAAIRLQGEFAMTNKKLGLLPQEE